MELPLGTGTVDVELPDCDVTVADPPAIDPVDPRAAAERAMADPHGPPLDEVASPDDDVAVVVTDVTRSVPTETLLSVLLEDLPVPGERVTVVLGLGLHRPMTDAEIEAGLGEFADLAINHDPDAAVRVGEVPGVREGLDGCELRVHPAVADADLVLSTGVVEPHQYAGFSGGAKTVVIGAGGEPLIRYTHGPDVLSLPGVRLGRVDGNPFRETVDAAGDVAGPDFCLNVAAGGGGLLAASAGQPRPVVTDLAERARAALSVSLPSDVAYDAVVAGVGAPKDANLYQASRAATYVVLGDRNPVRPGGRLVLPALLPEGAGEGTGERRFYERLSGAESPGALYEELREGYEPGAQRAFVVARALQDHDVYVTDSRSPEVVESCLMHAREHVVDAVEPGSDVLVVPKALSTLLTSASPAP